MLRFEASLCVLDKRILISDLQNLALVSNLSFYPLNRVFLQSKSLFWWRPICLFFPLVNYAFGVKPKNSLPNSRSERFSPVIFYKFYSLKIFWVKVLFFFFFCWWISISPAPFIEKAVHPPFSRFCSFVKN